MSRKVSKQRFLEVAAKLVKYTSKINGELTYLMEDLWGIPPEQGWALLVEAQGYGKEEVTEIYQKLKSAMDEKLKASKTEG